MKISDRDLRGRPVISADGRVLGHVAGLSLETDGPLLSTLEIELRKNFEEELGVEHRVFRSATIELPFAQVQSIGETVVLSVGLDELRAPTTQLTTSAPASS